jgi:choline dehydrogenase
MPVPDFKNHLPVRIEFGPGCLASLPGIAREVAAVRIAIVGDPVVLQLASVRRCLDGLADSALTIEIDVASGEPTIESVDAVGERLRTFAPDLVVAIGGGSALDTGKGARALLKNPGSISVYTWPGDPRPLVGPDIPLVTIPTTSGTGSEVTGGVVMNDPAKAAKVAAPSPLNRAQYCLVDPELTLGLPHGPTLWGGLDALGQAIGSVIAKVHTPVGDGLGLEAIRLARQALPVVLADPTDLAARSDMACAALLAGLAMNVSESGTEHSLAHPLGSIHHLPHGLTVGLMLAESMEHDRQYEPERFERIADAMGAPPSAARDGSRAVLAVREFLAQVGCPTLVEAGVDKADIDTLVTCAIEGWIPVEPGPWSAGDVRQAYERAFSLASR